jgi:hypothetical protein
LGTRFVLHHRIVSAVKTEEFVSDRVSCNVLRDPRYIFVWNVHAPSEEKRDDSKDRVCDELERVLVNIFLSTEILMQRWGENIFKPTTGNDSLHKGSNYNGVRIVNFAKSKNLVKSTMFPHRNIHKYTWTSPDGKIHNQIDHTVGDSIRV